MPNIGLTELIVILVIVLLLFGAKKLPEVAKSLGSSVNAFKAGFKEDKDEGKKDNEDGDKTKP